MAVLETPSSRKRRISSSFAHRAVRRPASPSGARASGQACPEAVAAMKASMWMSCFARTPGWRGAGCSPDFVPPGGRGRMRSIRAAAVRRGTDLPLRSTRVHGAGEYPKKLRDATHPIEFLYYPRLVGSCGVPVRCRRWAPQSVARWPRSGASSHARTRQRRLHRCIGTGRWHRFGLPPSPEERRPAACIPTARSPSSACSWFGAAALERSPTKTSAGTVANELLYRHDEAWIEVVAKDGRGASTAATGALFRLVSEAQHSPRAPLFDPPPGSSPVVLPSPPVDLESVESASSTPPLRLTRARIGDTRCTTIRRRA